MSDSTDSGLSGRRSPDGAALLDAAIWDAIPDPCYALDADLRIMYANRPALRLWGLSCSQVVGRRLWDLFPTAKDTPFGKRLDEAIAARRIGEFELLSPISRRWMWVRVSPFADGRTGVFWRDTTDRRRTEETLRASEERLRALNEHLTLKAETDARRLAASQARMQAFFEQSLDWLSLFQPDADGGFRYVDLNPACADAYGLARSDVIGRRLEEVLGAEQATLPTHLLREAVRTGQPQNYQARRTLAGRTRSIHVVFVPIAGDGGAVRTGAAPLILSTARDLTVQTELEAQLRQAMKMEAVGNLTGGVAHDFNNLLTAVISSLELIQGRSSEERVQRLASTALRAALRGAELTGQLLAFARRQTLHPRVVDPVALLAETATLLRPALGETIELTFDTAADLWRVKVDAVQFQTAVMNLVLNARDATEAGGPPGGLVVIGAENVHVAEGAPDLPVGDYVVVRVSDLGEGMSPEVLARACEPFFTTKTVGKGSGLGLSMVHGFVTQSGGAIRIASAPRSGTTVRLFLPREHAPRMPAAAAAPVPAADMIPMRILLVEDNDDVRASEIEVLQSMGHTVLAASSGAAALEILGSTAEVDLLLSDVVMPGGLDGPGLADAARELRPSLPVLLTSGYAAGALGGPADQYDFISKPFEVSSLARALNAALARDRMQGASTGS